jgi:hypothetical protein
MITHDRNGDRSDIYLHRALDFKCAGELPKSWVSEELVVGEIYLIRSILGHSRYAHRCVERVP